jgi:hypothetical protein
MGRRSMAVAVAGLATVVACTSEPTPGPTPASTTPAPSASPDAEPSPVPVSPEGVPVPATPPAGIVATTASGDIVVIELPTLALTSIARYPPVEPKGEVQTFFVSAITVTPEERILLSTCCEPAGGSVRTLNFNGRESKSPPDFGDDPELDPTGRLVVRGDIDGLSIAPVERRRIGRPFFLTGKSGYFAADPAWSPDSERIAYTLKGRLYVIDAAATSIRGLDPIQGKRGTYWGPIAWTSTGLLVAEIDGRFDDPGPSRIVRVDPATGTATELWRSGGTITDLATSRQPNAYLWVAGGTLHWNLGGTESSLDGEYVKAAFFPG